MRENADIFIRELTKRRQKIFEIMTVTLAIVLIAFMIYITGGAMYVNVHFMYLPIIMSAYFFDMFWTVVISSICGILIGPFMPLDTSQNIMQTTENWIIRLIIFVGVGVFINILYFFVKAKNKKTNVILEEINEGICGISLTGKIKYINKKLCLMMNIEDPQNLIGKNIKDMLVNNDNEHTSISIEDALHNRTTIKHFPCMLVNFHQEYISIDMSLYMMEYSKKSHECIITFSNNVERLTYQNKLHELSYSDDLTKLRNRRCFVGELRKYQKLNEDPLSLVLWDIDGLKFINDSFGRKTGDFLITRSADILNSNLNGLGFVSRLDGDEFGVLLHTNDTNVVQKYINDVKEEFHSFLINDVQMSISNGYEIRETGMSLATLCICQLKSGPLKRFNYGPYFYHDLLSSF